MDIKMWCIFTDHIFIFSLHFRKWHHMLTAQFRHASLEIMRGERAWDKLRDPRGRHWTVCVQLSTTIYMHEGSLSPGHLDTVFTATQPWQRCWTTQYWAKLWFHSMLQSTGRERGNNKGGQHYHTWAMLRELLSLSFQTFKLFLTETWN